MSHTLRKKIIILFLSFTFAASFGYAQTKVKKTEKKLAVITFSVSGMTCEGCVANVESKLKKIDGVKDYKVSLKKNSAVVKFNPKKTSEKEIEKIMNKTHYKFTKKTVKKKNAKPDKIKK